MQSTSQSSNPSSSEQTPNRDSPQYFEKNKAAVEAHLTNAVDPLRKSLLQEIFNTDAWKYQDAPLDAAKLREMRLPNTDNSGFKCPFTSICSKNFDHSTPALEHLEEHLGHKGYACPQCQLTFRRHSDMLDHEERHSVKPIPCPKNCGETFRGTKNINRHLRNSCPNASS